ncbi:MAG: prephenate dehydrogenase/arogenate dehydrogenase family protein, partial [Candidatus Omnitrophica bacterium]|nr:prephenate dehydrogenase/arogenate dehydrogenase family protein [Candidatus Omnitrophota bacterium]
MFKKIAIIGLGLMGGSLAAACRKRFPRTRIVGITRNPKALALAKKKKWIHEGTSDVAVGASGADGVVVCTPVGTYLPILKKIDRICEKYALVMDVGSVKASVAAEVNRVQWKNLFFVGCHPMVGSHDRGIEAASPDLYDGG